MNDLMSTINGFDILMMIAGFFLGRYYDRVKEIRKYKKWSGFAEK